MVRWDMTGPDHEGNGGDPIKGVGSEEGIRNPGTGSGMQGRDWVLDPGCRGGIGMQGRDWVLA